MTSSNGGKGVPTGYLLLPVEASGSRTGLHSIELSVKGSHGDPQTTKAVPKTMGKLCRVLLLRTTPVQLTEQGSQAGAYTEPSSLHPFLWCGKVLFRVPQEKRGHNL